MKPRPTKKSFEDKLGDLLGRQTPQDYTKGFAPDQRARHAARILRNRLGKAQDAANTLRRLIHD